MTLRWIAIEQDGRRRIEMRWESDAERSAPARHA